MASGWDFEHSSDLDFPSLTPLCYFIIYLYASLGILSCCLAYIFVHYLESFGKEDRAAINKFNDTFKCVRLVESKVHLCHREDSIASWASRCFPYLGFPRRLDCKMQWTHGWPMEPWTGPEVCRLGPVELWVSAHWDAAVARAWGSWLPLFTRAFTLSCFFFFPLFELNYSWYTILSWFQSTT